MRLDPAVVFRGWTPGPEYQIDPREHLGTVVWSLQHYRHLAGAVPVEDLVQLALETLLVCARKNANADSFAGYVRTSIWGEFKNLARAQQRIVRSGVGRPGRLRRFCREAASRGELTLDGVRAEFPFLANRDRHPDADVARVVEWCLGSDLSADAPTRHGEGAPLIDTVAGEDVDFDATPSTAGMVAHLAAGLDPRERVLFERVIADDDDDAERHSLRALGAAHGGVSRQRMHQIAQRMRRRVIARLGPYRDELLEVLRPSQRARVARALEACP